ncbi:hypothetical protein PG988_013726 [Apiospora saccharicola]
MVQITPARNMFLLSTALVSARAASTESYEPVYYTGVYNLSSSVSNVTAALYEQAAANPNATRSVKLHPFGWYSGQNPDYYRDIEWSWRVNVSDFAATDADSTSGDGTPLVDPHVELTTYDFSWAGGQNLSDQIRTNHSVCLTVAMSYTWPANITNRYADGNTDDGSCDAVLGEACRRAIETKGQSRPQTDQCESPTTSWADLPECAGSFGYARTRSRFSGTSSFDLNGYNGTKNRVGSSGRGGTLVPGGTPNPTSGTGFLAFNSYPRNATNETEYYEAANRLHVVMINAMLPINNGAMGAARLYCMRVNTTKVEWEDPGSSAVHGAGMSTAATAVVGMMMVLSLII